MPADPVKRLPERDEVAGNEVCALMKQLIEGMLPVGARFAPVDWTGLVVHGRSGKRDVLAIALHRQLLKVGRETL